MNSNFIIFMAALVLVICVVAYLLLKPERASKAEIERLQREYKDALARKDKAAAVDAGRKYYAALRGGDLTIFDEQAISNDLAAIQ